MADLHILVLDEEDFPVNVAPEIRQAFRRAQEVFSLLGATMENIHSPFDFNEIARLNGELIAVEAWNVHRDYIEDESLPIGYWVRKRVLSGKEISANHHTSLLKRHSEFRRVWRDWIPPGTVLLLPALPVVACPIDEADESTIPLGAFARAANFLGACGITFPAGSTSIGLPIALQLMSGPFGEAALLRACHAFQSKTKWHLRIPSNLDS